MLQKEMKRVIDKIDMMFLEMSTDEINKALRRPYTFVENVCDELEMYPYEELVEWCIKYCKIKYDGKHPLNGFFE